MRKSKAESIPPKRQEQERRREDQRQNRWRAHDGACRQVLAEDAHERTHEQRIQAAQGEQEAENTDGELLGIEFERHAEKAGEQGPVASAQDPKAETAAAEFEAAHEVAEHSGG